MLKKTDLEVINSNKIDFIGIQFDFCQSMNNYVEKKSPLSISTRSILSISYQS